MLTLIPIVALLTFAIGAGALWANPRRLINQVFALYALTSITWLGCFYMAIYSGIRFQTDPTWYPVPWIRSATAAGALFPLVLWLLKEAIVTQANRFPALFERSLPWLAVCLGLACLCYTNYFIPFDSIPGPNERRGPAYPIYGFSNVVLYTVILIQAHRGMKSMSGIRRLEAQLLTINGGVMCLTILLITVLGYYLKLRTLNRLSPIVMLVFYAFTAWAITFHRIFDARQVFLTAMQRLVLVAFLSSGIYFTWTTLSQTLPKPADLIVAVVVWCILAFWLEEHTKNWLALSPWQRTAATRQNALDLARREADPNKLVSEFEGLIRTSWQTEYAVLLFDSGEVFVAGDVEFGKDRAAYSALCKMGWATPESLQRLRPEPGLVDLRQFLTEFNLGLIVTAPRGSPMPSLLVALGVKTNQRPFTYPEVLQVQEMAEFLDNILARSRLSLQARQSEQLATIGLIGASLAHEIRNPLVSIKTFSHLLPSRFDDPEFRRRFALLIPAEVDRIDNLTQQLLDLSNPRRHQMERVSLHAIMQETTDLMLTRANEARVSISADLIATSDTIWADAGAVRQVLINLLINAFQAMEHQDGARRVQLRSRNSPNGNVILEVSDNGPGIPPEQRSRLFHPFASTKTKGMGLGLAVCADILHEHRATIIVPDIGKPGATFRITFPCPPPLS